MRTAKCLKGVKLDAALRARLVNNVDTSAGPNGCCPWQKACDKDGYGITHGVTLNGDIKTLRVHRLAWVLSKGEIPVGKSVLHRCDNPPCVNPAHLWCGTTTDNNRDRSQKGRWRGGRPSESARGELNNNAKLTPEQVAAIRERYAEGNITQKRLAVEYNVAPSTIRCVVTGLSWRHT